MANRFSQIQQPFIVNPIGMDTFLRPEIARAQATKSTYRALDTLNTEYDVNLVDAPAVNRMTSGVERGKSQMVDEIMSNGVSAQMTTQFVKLKGQYDETDKMIKHAVANKQAKLIGDAAIAKQHAGNSGYIDLVQKKEYQKWADKGGTFGESGEIQEYNPGLGPKHFNPYEDVDEKLSGFHQSLVQEHGETAAKGSFEFINIEGTKIPQLVFRGSNGKILSDNQDATLKEASTLLSLYKDPSTERGQFASYTGLDKDNYSSLENMITSMANARIVRTSKSGETIRPLTGGGSGTSGKTPKVTEGGSMRLAMIKADENTTLIGSNMDPLMVAENKAHKTDEYKNLVEVKSAVRNRIVQEQKKKGNKADWASSPLSEVNIGQDPEVIAATEAYENRIAGSEGLAFEYIENELMKDLEQEVLKDVAGSMGINTIDNQKVTDYYDVATVNNIKYKDDLTKLKIKYKNKPDRLSSEIKERTLDYFAEYRENKLDYITSLAESSYQPEVSTINSSYTIAGRDTDKNVPNYIKDLYLSIEGSGIPILQLNSRTELIGKSDELANLKSAFSGGVKSKGTSYKATFLGNATGDYKFYTNSDGEYVDGLAYGSVVKVAEYEEGKPTGKTNTYLIGPNEGQKKKQAYVTGEPFIAAQANLSYGGVYKGMYYKDSGPVSMEIENTETGTYAIDPSMGENSAPIWAQAGSRVMYIEGDKYPRIYKSGDLKRARFNPAQTEFGASPLKESFLQNNANTYNELNK